MVLARGVRGRIGKVTAAKTYTVTFKVGGGFIEFGDNIKISHEALADGLFWLGKTKRFISDIQVINLKEESASLRLDTIQEPDIKITGTYTDHAFDLFAPEEYE